MSTKETTLNEVVSERDARLRERAAFAAGVRAGVERYPSQPLVMSGFAEREARRLYPIRKLVPRTAKLASGLTVEPGRDATVQMLPRFGGEVHHFTLADLDAMREIVQFPNREVEE